MRESLTMRVRRRARRTYGYAAIAALQPHLRFLHQEPVPNYVNERSYEYAFVLRSLVEDECKSVLDVGVGTNAFPAVLRHAGYDVIATDLKRGAQVQQHAHPRSDRRYL